MKRKNGEKNKKDKLQKKIKKHKDEGDKTAPIKTDVSTTASHKKKEKIIKLQEKVDTY